jgi:hypothetical protein
LIVLAAVLIVLGMSAACPPRTKGRVPYLLARVAVLGVLGAVLGLAAMPSRIKSYCVSRLAADWGAGKRSPWHVRAAWALLRPFLRGA